MTLARSRRALTILSLAVLAMQIVLIARGGPATAATWLAPALVAAGALLVTMLVMAAIVIAAKRGTDA